MIKDVRYLIGHRAGRNCELRRDLRVAVPLGDQFGPWAMNQRHSATPAP